MDRLVYLLGLIALFWLPVPYAFYAIPSALIFKLLAAKLDREAMDGLSVFFGILALVTALCGVWFFPLIPSPYSQIIAVVLFIAFFLF